MALLGNPACHSDRSDIVCEVALGDPMFTQLAQSERRFNRRRLPVHLFPE